MSVVSFSPDDPVIRILLMGRCGSGKSSSGNTILGENLFKEHEAEVCEGQTQIGGKQVVVIDCPDLLDPDLNKEQLVSGCSAGLSSVLITVPLLEPVQNEKEILDYVKCSFGPEVQKYIMILFTHKDDLEDLNQTIDEHLQNHADFQQLVTACGGKFHCFNNKKKFEGQVQELLQKIEGTMEENGGEFKQMRKRHSMASIVNFSGESPAEDPDEIHVIPKRKDQIRPVLLGETGSGKSATGNRNLFESSAVSNSETKRSSSETSVRMGKEISLIHTPGFIKDWHETHSRELG
ncbi:hypothetical protein cypCar_00044484 [Cyprinus carpio]|nr:GTPase IMAP family member 8-like isoform X2 [Cyprinus carpio]KTF88364.1 hypothetical protein cypCar_00044484 [Cyprinus carpio]